MKKCPKCKSEDIEASVDNTEVFTEVEIFCNKCEEIVAFYRIKDDEWILTIV